MAVLLGPRYLWGTPSWNSGPVLSQWKPTVLSVSTSGVGESSGAALPGQELGRPAVSHGTLHKLPLWTAKLLHL